MDKKEFNQVFEYIFAEEQVEPNKAIRLLFWDQFGGLEQSELMAAARLLKQRKTYGAPRCADVWLCIQDNRRSKLPASLTMSASEALACCGSPKLLIRDAEYFANRVAPPIAGRTQFSSEEELDKALRINQAIWDREFRCRFETKQKEVLTAVAAGEDPKQAIRRVVGMSEHVALPAPEMRTLIGGLARQIGGIK